MYHCPKVHLNRNHYWKTVNYPNFVKHLLKVPKGIQIYILMARGVIRVKVRVEMNLDHVYKYRLPETERNQARDGAWLDDR